MDAEEDQFQMAYANKVILAPMVRVNTLPFRLLAREYGADIVYSEEIVDLALMTTSRVVNEATGTIDFIRPDGKLCFRTIPGECPLVLQLGTASAETALKAALKVCGDVQAIDVNMGCPKHFSISGGMGAALLDKPEVVREILTTLVQNVPLPVTCKIRLKPTLQETIEFLKVVESTGIKAVAIHARTKVMRPTENAIWEQLKAIVDSKAISIPIIANGDVFCHEDIQKVKDRTGVHSVMIARGAARNPSVFSPIPCTVPQMMKEYLKYCIDTDNNFSNTKYVLMYMSKEQGKWLSQTPEGLQLHRSKSYDDLCPIWDLVEYYKEAKERLEEKIKSLAAQKTDFVYSKRTHENDGEDENEGQPPAKKPRTAATDTTTEGS